MKTWAVLILLTFAAVANADEPFDVTKPSVIVAVKRLSTTEVFAFGPTGYSGATSQGETDFNAIIAQPPKAALQTFESLYATGNPQAKGYALFGIRKLNDARFNDLLASLKTPDVIVKTQSGCIVGHQSLRAVAEQIRRGAYDHWPVSKSRPASR